MLSCLRTFLMRRRLPAHLASYAADFAALRPGDVALDLGANVGLFTALMARTGARVYAFEPNPHAFAQLKRNTANYPNATCLEKAVGAAPGTASLFLHVRSNENPVMWSTGSSLMAEKGNVDEGNCVAVERIDLSAFIASLEVDVALAKMDIEGIEVEVIEHLLKTGAMARIRRLLVETHDTKIPALRPGTDKLRERAKMPDLAGRIDFNWQ
ncbi:MAG: FkbM family methyltransferase [Rhodospirillales bacterium]|nr:MAG: FkbM family methyltransferase [Rhodospirillales bacterium]